MEEIKKNKGVAKSLKLYKGLGVVVFFKGYENGVLSVEVKQEEVLGGRLLTKNDLIEAGREIFKNCVKEVEGFNRVLVSPCLWEFNEGVVTIDWLQDKMRQNNLVRADIVKQVNIAKGNLSVYIAGTRKMSKGIKLRLFLYFSLMEVGKQ